MGKWADSGTDFQPAPVGTHLARCIRIIDLGTQHDEYKGKPTARRQTLITWELPLEQMDDGKSFIASKFYTASLNEKASLRHDLVAWRGREFTAEELAGFDPRNVLGKPCQVTVIKKESGKHGVSSVSGVPRGIQVPAAANPLVFFDLDEFEQSAFDALSDGIKKIIQQSDEWKAMFEQPVPKAHAAAALAKSPAAPDDDDIPF